MKKYQVLVSVSVFAASEKQAKFLVIKKLLDNNIFFKVLTAISEARDIKK